ncbi:melanocyte-stimulating hormone receptor-like [Montipora foliosa]|uniref:melanocyte-stimulating hormone receptor-like n=1 Tax=Montipora foliosa TaxID=591990 RepID=UPI0035F1AA36
MTMTRVIDTSVFCSGELTVGVKNHLICLAVFNIVFSFTAIVGNSLILVALHKETSLHPPSKVLLRGLVTSDLFVGLLEAVYAAYLISLLLEGWQICHYTFLACAIVAPGLVSVSLLTIATISVDRYLALSLGLRYRQVVTLKRVCVAVIVLWVYSLLTVAVSFYSRATWGILLVTSILLCVITSISCYAGIFAKLRHHKTQVRENVQNSANPTIPLNIKRYRKTVYGTMWLQLALVLCYLPYIVLAPLVYPKILSSQSPGSHFFILESLITLTFFNSSLNPVVYCWKIKEVRRALKDTLKPLCCLRYQ